MKTRSLLLGLAAALALAGHAAAQQTRYPSGQGTITDPGTLAKCLNSQGYSVPCPLADTTPSVTRPYAPASPEHRSEVVTISPNSGSPGPYPAGAVPLVATATGTTGGATATFAAVAGRTNYLCGFTVSPGSAATAITITITTTGLVNNMSLSVGAPVTAVGVTGSIVTVPISPCIPASAINTAITVVAGALSTSGVGQAVNAWGFRQ